MRIVLLSRTFYQGFKSFSKMSSPASMKRKMPDEEVTPNGKKQQKLSNFFVKVETPPKKIDQEKKTDDDGVIILDQTVKASSSSNNDVAVAVGGNASSKENDGLFALLTEKSWRNVLRVEFNKPYFKGIENFLKTATDGGKTIYPPRPFIFNAFNLTPLHELKVVIIGQDPYHGVGQAHGLSFSVPRNVIAPPSLKNIYTEMEADLDGFKKPNHGCLEAWAKRGVLLLNATLTVEAHKANSHAAIGWQTFTDAVIKQVANDCENLVFILWGGFAQRKAALIGAAATKRGHTVIRTAHPSPLSVTKFYGCRCFSKANEALKKSGKGEIDWSLD